MDSFNKINGRHPPVIIMVDFKEGGLTSSNNGGF